MNKEIGLNQITYLKIIKNLKKCDNQQKNPIEIAKKIYKSKGEEYLIIVIFVVMSHLGSDILKKMHNINEEFKWYFKFLEEAFKLVGAKESAYWLREDFAKCLESWSIYCDEKNKGKPRRTISMQCKVSKN